MRYLEVRGSAGSVGGGARGAGSSGANAFSGLAAMHLVSAAASVGSRAAASARGGEAAGLSSLAGIWVARVSIVDNQITLNSLQGVSLGQDNHEEGKNDGDENGDFHCFFEFFILRKRP